MEKDRAQTVVKSMDSSRSVDHERADRYSGASAGGVSIQTTLLCYAQYSQSGATGIVGIPSTLSHLRIMWMRVKGQKDAQQAEARPRGNQ